MVSLLRWSVTIAFILFRSFLQFVCPDTSGTYLLYFCDNRFNYTQNSVFQNNLKLTLTNLTSETPLTNYYNFTFGERVDKVYALLFCPAYIAAQDCHTCIQSAAKFIIQNCPNQKGAIIYYVECVLRYANYSFFSMDEESPSIYWNSSTSFDNPDQFNQVLTTKMEGLVDKAAFGSLTPTSATGEGNITLSQQLYCFVQCIPYINGSACSTCLHTALSDLQTYCYGDEWALLYGPNCQMRYSLSPFYAVAPSPSLPPSGPKANTTLGSVATSSSQPSLGKKRNSSIIFISISILAVSFTLLVIFIVNYLKSRKVRISGEATENVDSTPSVESLQFDLSTIRDATGNFSSANKLGEGGFGPVYKGVLVNGQEIAVKKLSGNSKQGHEEFKNEVLLLARLNHRNLVNLLGFCLEGKENLLIYEFMPNKSLDHFIFDPINRARLDWTSRYRIIQGIAKGLLYLHEDSQERIIHRDLKASNILLDSEMEPKISDFGTARLMLFDRSDYTASKIMGTIGYMAPEYVKHGRFSVKSDVFSFGVMLLEILCGQKIFCFRDREDCENLLSYAWKKWRNSTALDIVDSALLIGPRSEIMRCVHISLLCVQENAAQRPTMPAVVNMLTSSSYTLSLPSRPAYLVPKRLDRGNLLLEFNSMVTESYQPDRKSVQWSVNEASITELDAR